MCMSMRGVQKPGATTVTSTMLGCFRKQQKTREEVRKLMSSQLVHRDCVDSFVEACTDRRFSAVHDPDSDTKRGEALLMNATILSFLAA